MGRSKGNLERTTPSWGSISYFANAVKLGKNRLASPCPRRMGVLLVPLKINISKLFEGYPPKKKKRHAPHLHVGVFIRRGPGALFLQELGKGRQVRRTLQAIGAVDLGSSRQNSGMPCCRSPGEKRKPFAGSKET